MAECSICLAFLKDDEAKLITDLDCSNRHQFHQECLTKWIVHNDNCPLCREKINADDKPSWDNLNDTAL